MEYMRKQIYHNQNITQQETDEKREWTNIFAKCVDYYLFTLFFGSFRFVCCLWVSEQRDCIVNKYQQQKNNLRKQIDKTIDNSYKYTHKHQKWVQLK